jgi:hypothetical protein
MITLLGLVVAVLLLPVLVSIVGGVFALLFVRGAVVKAAEDIGQRALEKQPDQIHLAKRGPQAWAQPDAAGALALPLLENGFRDVGSFAVEELPGLLVRLMTDERNGLLGVVYEHPRMPHWVEFVTRYEDGTVTTFTTLRPTGLSPLPGYTTTYAPGLDAGALLHRTLEERPRGQVKGVTLASAVQLFERGYEEQIAARKRRGVSAREVARVASRRVA